MKTLEPSINFIKTSKDSFYMEKNIRFIDLDNISKYSKKGVFSILISAGISTNPNYTKKVMIDMLFRSEKALNKIKSDNREYLLNKLIK